MSSDLDRTEADNWVQEYGEAESTQYLTMYSLYSLLLSLHQWRHQSKCRGKKSTHQELNIHSSHGTCFQVTSIQSH